MSFNKLQSLNNIDIALGGLGQNVNEIQALDDIASKLSTGAPLASGLYTPIASNLVNLTVATPVEAQFLRVGKTVMVTGRLDFTPTALGVFSLFLSLPIASDIQFARQVAGAANNNVGSTNNYPALGITGDIPTNSALLVGVVVVGPGVAASMFYTYGYAVLP